METFSEHYESLIRTLVRRMPGTDMDKIERAIEYADTKHKHQRRKDGDCNGRQ